MLTLFFLLPTITDMCALVASLLVPLTERLVVTLCFREFTTLLVAVLLHLLDHASITLYDDNTVMCEGVTTKKREEEEGIVVRIEIDRLEREKTNKQIVGYKNERATQSKVRTGAGAGA